MLWLSQNHFHFSLRNFIFSPIRSINNANTRVLVLGKFSSFQFQVDFTLAAASSCVKSKSALTLWHGRKVWNKQTRDVSSAEAMATLHKWVYELRSYKHECLRRHFHFNMRLLIYSEWLKAAELPGGEKVYEKSQWNSLRQLKVADWVDVVRLLFSMRWTRLWKCMCELFRSKLN